MLGLDSRRITEMERNGVDLKCARGQTSLIYYVCDYFRFSA